MDILRRIGLMSAFFCAFIYCNHLHGQDLVVTIQGDSLNVKIQKDTDQFIYYRTPNSKRGDFVISKKEVTDFVYGFYLNDNEDYTPSNSGPDEVSELYEEKKQRFQIWGTGGFGYYLAFPDENAQDAEKEYFKQLRKGYTFGLGANVFFTERYGVGAVYEQSAFSHTFDGFVEVVLPDTSFIGGYADDIEMRHIGLSFIMRFAFKRNTSALQLSAGLGYSSYVNDATLVGDFKYEGSTLGIALSAEYQIGLGGNLYLPFKIGLNNVAFTQMKVTLSDGMPEELGQGLKDYYENGLLEEPLTGSRFSATIGLLFAF